ncbi:diguanylate cyclase [Thermodesulfobacteriota bacterium]
MRNIKFLRLIIVISLLTAISLNCFIIFFLSPSFTNLIIKNTELEAIKVGRYLSEQFREVPKISRELPTGFVEIARQAISDFGLMKIKVFAPDGEIVFSSSEKEIGTINEKDYFHNFVAKGGVFTKVVKKDTKSLEDQVVSVDVVETYVPIMFADSFAGAFEVYFDITENKNELKSLLFKSNSLMLLIAVGLMTAVLVISLIARHSFIEQEQAEEKIIQQSIDLQGRNSELLLLNDVAKVLSKSMDLETLLPLVLEKVVNSLPVINLKKKGGIMLVDGEKMKLAAHLGHDDSFMKLHEDITIHDCLCGLAVRSGEIIFSGNSNDDSRHTICEGDIQPHGHIIVPIKSAHKVVGVFFLYLPADTEVGEFNGSLLESIASQIGMAIDNARLYGEAKKMALHDSLTGLANRRLMFISLKQAVKLAERYGKPLCVAMFDIDFFKKFNDTRGHDAGDKLLAKVADKITMSIRESDLVARYGGEEFLLILPESGLSPSRLTVDRIRKNIEETLEVTVSAGVALYEKGSSIEDLIKAADEALYKAKENGRNRVECA